MKKLFVLFALILFTATVFAQDYGVNFTVATPSTKAQFLIPKNSTIKVKSTHIDYSVLKDIPAGTLFSTAIADVTWVYPVGSTASSTATITTLTSTTANITTANVATTLTLPGTTTVTKTTGNANSATFSGSIVTDTLTAPLVSATSKLILPGTNTVSRKDANGSTFDASFTIAGTDTLFAPVVSSTTVRGTTMTASGNVTGATIGVSGVDTVTAAPVGSLVYRAADSTLWLKIKLTGPKSARWQKVTVGK